ncbi:MAG TPA: DUF885 domain-containing protein [Myxococcales bacterium]|nr:DUF885 domain-containing protein [Myxococcales bacterium]
MIEPRILLSALLVANALAAPASDPAALRAMARDYYAWHDRENPVNSSDQGLHTWDDQLSDRSMPKVLERRKLVEALLAKVKALPVADWSKDDRVDSALFRAQLEQEAFSGRVLRFEETNPQLYVNECSTGIFSLLKKEYAPRRTRALAATARLRRMPAFLEQARKNLTRPVALYARLAAEAARRGDDLYQTSLMVLAGDLSPAEKQELTEARDAALSALHSFAAWLESRIPKMAAFVPMGRANYDLYLRHVHLLPFDAAQIEMLGQAELSRYRGLEALLPDPSLASPDPARAKSIPSDQQAFLTAYQAREKEMIEFMEKNRLITLPPWLGPFSIRQLPEAFKPTSPGGFMNPPGLYDKDPEGFFFIPTYNPKSQNFYIRAAIEDPRPILGHEGIPGHFLQISVANHLQREIRRQHSDNVFVEGWALYGEEMLSRQGLYPENSAAQGQVLRLSRYRAARIGVDVNLQTGKWSFEQAVRYFMEAGGLDHEAAEGEAAGAASSPLQKIGYMTGKSQIMGLLGRYRDRKGKDFRLGTFHDELISYGSLPVSVIEWLMLDDRASLDAALR